MDIPYRQLDAIYNSKYFSKLDLASEYWQVLLNPRDRDKMAFSMHLGIYESLRLLFGLKTAPKTFQRILNTVFCEFLFKCLVIYIDDCLIWEDTQQEGLLPISSYYTDTCCGIWYVV